MTGMMEKLNSKMAASLILVFAIMIVLWKNARSDVSGAVGTVADLDVLIEHTSRLPPLSYRKDFPTQPALSSALAAKSWSNFTAGRDPDTTAVILNWSRFHNVQRIVSSLCSSELDHVIKEVFVWNNNPNQIHYTDFPNTMCPENKLRIHNSPENTYFYGRFLACSQAKTTFCYIQDDDYLILPEVIQSLYMTITSSPQKSGDIHLLPPHEHLTTTLRTLHHTGNNLHTTFAWLGHGAMVSRSRVTHFVSTMDYLNMTTEEKQMADNYFSILQEHGGVTTIWVDQGIELGGGQPFTVGTEGDERNRRHIRRAAQYLDLLAGCESETESLSEPCPSIPSGVWPTYGYADYPAPDSSNWKGSSSDESPRTTPITNRSPCYGRPCLFETTVSVLPDAFADIRAPNVESMLDVEEKNRIFLGPEGENHYLEHAAKYAVDGKPETSFRSYHHARKHDVVALDMLVDVSLSWDISGSEMVLLVDNATETILRSCVFESSTGEAGVAPKNKWVSSQAQIACSDVDIHREGPYTNYPDARAFSSSTILRECSVRMSAGQSPNRSSRLFRARLTEDVAQRWSIHEVWMRGKLPGIDDTL